MLAVGLSQAGLTPYIAKVVDRDDASDLVCGCINSPQSTTVTGSEGYINELASLLQADRIFTRKLSVPIAYHSQQMLAVAESYRLTLEGHLTSSVRGANTCRPWPVLISSVTGMTASNDDLRQPEYWVSNLVSMVRFSEALQFMCHSSSQTGQGYDTHVKPLTYLLEVGPHCSLERPVRDTLADFDHFVYDYSIRRNVSSIETVKRMAGSLVMHGYAADVQAINTSGNVLSERQPRLLLDLPRYPFNHSRSYWIEIRLSKNVRTRTSPRHELLGNRSDDWNSVRPVWRFTITVSDMPWVADHKVSCLGLPA